VRHQLSLKVAQKNTRGMATVMAGKFPKGILTEQPFSFGKPFSVNSW
jgi:hypothetical protein